MGAAKNVMLNFSFFNFRIEHKPGKELVDADHISRQTNLPNAPLRATEDPGVQRHLPPPLPPRPVATPGAA